MGTQVAGPILDSRMMRSSGASWPSISSRVSLCASRRRWRSSRTDWKPVPLIDGTLMDRPHPPQPQRGGSVGPRALLSLNLAYCRRPPRPAAPAAGDRRMRVPADPDRHFRVEGVFELPLEEGDP